MPTSDRLCHLSRDGARVRRILVFDSGLGGLTVYREIAAARPDADFLYVADDAGFPYGGLARRPHSSRASSR